MTQQRLKGQEVTVLISAGGALQTELTDIQNFNFEPESEVKTQGYLGEKSNRHDDIFNGVKFDFEMHTHSQDYLTFLQMVNDRQKRISPDTVFNISLIAFYPNGQTPSINIKDCKFAGQPVSIGGRGEYAKVKISGNADDMDIVFG